MQLPFTHEMQTFGVPCPTAILTAGLLLFLPPSAARVPAWLTLLWCAIGGSAAFALGIRSDVALPVAGGLVLIHVLRSSTPLVAAARATRSGLEQRPGHRPT